MAGHYFHTLTVTTCEEFDDVAPRQPLEHMSNCSSERIHLSEHVQLENQEPIQVWHNQCSMQPESQHELVISNQL